MRGSIHCHGVAKLKNDPGLCHLTQVALKGHLAEKALSSETNQSSDTLVELNSDVNSGKIAAKQVCDYIDSLVTAWNPRSPEDGWVRPKVHPCKKRYNKLKNEDFDNDYADLVNCVQRHTKCSSAYCLRKKPNGEQFCRFNFPFQPSTQTFIDFEEVKTKKSGVQYRPKIVLKRNDTRVNKHQRLMLQSWRANTDLQPIVDYKACLEYLSKYASKSEKLSDVARDAFVSIIGNSNKTNTTRSIIQKLMIKAAGERDFSVQEVMHNILSLKMISSSYQVVNTSVEGTRKINICEDGVETDRSTVDQYANCENLKGCNSDILASNFVQFVANYTVHKDEIKKRKKPVIVRAFPCLYSNPKSVHYPTFCKYQLLKFKPWRNSINTAWDNLDVEDTNLFCEKWSEFLQSHLGQALVPNWRRQLDNAEVFSETTELVDSDLEENIEENIREEWMHLADLCVNDVVEENDIENVDNQYWQSFQENYSDEQIGNIPSWLDRQKENFTSEPNPLDSFKTNASSLNAAQRKAFDIVANHLEQQKKQLLMIISGVAGSGKSFVINNIKVLLREKCVVTAYFGIAAFNVKGKTLRSLLRLPIRGKNQHDLKGPALLQLQERLSGVKYLIIDEYSVVGQSLLGWIDDAVKASSGWSHLEPFGYIYINRSTNLNTYVKLSFSNEKVARDNYEVLEKLCVPIAQINARHSNKASAKLASDDMGGLERKLFLCIGARVMLTRNLWTEKGLCNGSMGIVKDIVYSEGDTPPLLPISVIVRFDTSYSGPSFLENESFCVPIVPVTNTSDVHGSTHERQQLPIRLSWAITIHKSQGLTLDKAWIDLGITERFIGLAYYVAVSRVRKLTDLIIEPMTLERLRDIKNKNNYKYRIAEEERLQSLAKLTME